MAKKYFYRFYGNKIEGDITLGSLLGGKGAGLAEMAKLGVPVPAGFTMTTDLCKNYYGYKTPKARANYAQKLGKVYAMTQYRYLSKYMGYHPLVSVRSGAAISMPGMMDTVLNVGLTDDTFPYWEEKLGKRGALDCLRRLIQMYGTVVKGIDSKLFEIVLRDLKKQIGVKHDSELDADGMAWVVSRFYVVYSKQTGEGFPTTLEDQMAGCIEAVFKSWNSARAIMYRKINAIAGDIGTAINVQTMVFGNINDESATGVLFTRNPSTGEKAITGEFLINAQGEDVVSGVRTPQPLDAMIEWNAPVHHALTEVATMLEDHHGEMQDIEFTVENGKLYILQARSGKRTSLAAIRIAYEMAKEELISVKVAASRVTGLDVEKSCQPVLANAKAADATGIAAGGGVVTGQIALTSYEATQMDGPTILVSHETTPEDIAGMDAAIGILTQTGGLTSHAAVVARGMNKTCVVGCEALRIGKTATLNGKAIETGMWITVCGATGNVWASKEEIVGGTMPMEAQALIELAGGATKPAIQTIDLTATGVVVDAESKGFLLMPSRVELSQADKDYMALLGCVNQGDMLQDWAQHMIAELGANAYYVPAWFSDDAQATLDAAGVSKARLATTAADLMTGGVVYCEEKFIKEVMGGAGAAETLIEMVQATGTTVYLAKRELTLIETAYKIFG